MFQRPLWYDVVKYAPPIRVEENERLPRRAQNRFRPKFPERSLYQALLRARPMLRAEPLNSLSNTPSLGFRFVTAQMMLMKNDKLDEKQVFAAALSPSPPRLAHRFPFVRSAGTQAFAATMKVMGKEIENFEDNLHRTGFSKFRVSKERVLQNMSSMFAGTVTQQSAATAAKRSLSFPLLPARA